MLNLLRGAARDGLVSEFEFSTQLLEEFGVAKTDVNVRSMRHIVKVAFGLEGGPAGSWRVPTTVVLQFNPAAAIGTEAMSLLHKLRAWK